MSTDVVCQERRLSPPSLRVLLKRFRGALHGSHGSYHLHSRGSGLFRSHGPQLLDLPYEIREKILLHVLARHPLVHIIRHKGPPRRLRTVCCQDADPFGKPPSLHHCWSEHLYYVNHRNYPHVFGDPKEEGRVTGEANVGFLGLLLACRQIYTESIALLFAHNVFDLLHIDALSLLSNPAYLPARHFHSIRHLRLSLHPSADFYHSQPKQPLAPADLREIYAPFISPTARSFPLTARNNPNLPAASFKYSDWLLVWNIIPRMRSLSTVQLRLNALCGPACDFPNKCSLLRPLVKVGWRDAEGGLGLEALGKFEVVVKWNERRFQEIAEVLEEECRLWMETNGLVGIRELPYRLVAEERLEWGCVVPWAG